MTRRSAARPGPLALRLLAAAGLATAALWVSGPGTSDGAGAAVSTPSGPFVAGVTTLELPSGPVDVWYPADRAAARGHPRATYDLADWLPPDLAARVPPGLGLLATQAYRDITPARGRRYPTVLFAHGLYSFRDQSTFLTTWLATWGYVVAAPELTSNDLTAYFENLGRPTPSQPTDYQILVATEQLLRADGAAPNGLLHGLVNTRSFAVIGHSLGGLDAIEFAQRPEIAVYVDMAGANGESLAPMPAKPALFMTGTDDHDVRPAWVRDLYLSAPTPKRFVSLAGAGHLAFTDLCLIGRNRGGVTAIGASLGLALPVGAPFTGRAVDGCGPENLPPTAGFAVVRRAVLAALRAMPGFGPSRPGR